MTFLLLNLGNLGRAMARSPNLRVPVHKHAFIAVELPVIMVKRHTQHREGGE